MDTGVQDTGVQETNALGGAHTVKLGHEDQVRMTTVENNHRRIAFCECGAQLIGDSEQELFHAAQRHLAHRHPQLLGALEPGMVHQMAEDVGGR